MYRSLKNSLSSILRERTTSPFYGTVIVSWLIWNWKIIYLTFFISESEIDGDKISYISENYSNIHHLITYPLISTLIILTIIPFISNGAFWLNLNFEKWKRDKNNEIDKKQLLTLEQSIELREQLINQEVRFEKLLNNKSNEITQLKGIIEEYSTDFSSTKTPINKESNQSIDFDEISRKIKNIDKNLVGYQRILQLIQSGYGITDRSDVPTKLITLLEVYDIISTSGGGNYNLTKNGKQLTKKLII
jgi:hypothetical protein